MLCRELVFSCNGQQECEESFTGIPLRAQFITSCKPYSHGARKNAGCYYVLFCQKMVTKQEARTVINTLNQQWMLRGYELREHSLNNNYMNVFQKQDESVEYQVNLHEINTASEAFQDEFVLVQSNFPRYFFEFMTNVRPNLKELIYILFMYFVYVQPILSIQFLYIPYTMTVL